MSVMVTSTSQLEPWSRFEPVNCHCRPTTWAAFASDQLEKSASGLTTVVASEDGTAILYTTGKL